MLHGGNAYFGLWIVSKTDKEIKERKKEIFRWRIERGVRERDRREREKKRKVHMAHIHRTKANGNRLQLILFEKASEERPREGMKIEKEKLGRVPFSYRRVAPRGEHRRRAACRVGDRTLAGTKGKVPERGGQRVPLEERLCPFCKGWMETEVLED